MMEPHLAYTYKDRREKLAWRAEVLLSALGVMLEVYFQNIRLSCRMNERKPRGLNGARTCQTQEFYNFRGYSCSSTHPTTPRNQGSIQEMNVAIPTPDVGLPRTTNWKEYWLIISSFDGARKGTPPRIILFNMIYQIVKLSNLPLSHLLGNYVSYTLLKSSAFKFLKRSS